MNLTEKSEVINLPAQHYVFVEKIGPFQETAKAAWDELHKNFNTFPEELKKVGAMALFKMHPQMIYRAGFIVNEKPASLPKGIQYEKNEGGKYSKFSLTGSYMNLGPAWGKTMETIEKTKLPVREAFFVEHYVNDPKTTREDQLITELMVPMK